MPETATTADGATLHLIVLTFWDKVAIIAGSCGFLLLLSLCMACILCPQCILHTLCCADSDESKKKKKKIGNIPQTCPCIMQRFSFSLIMIFFFLIFAQNIDREAVLTSAWTHDRCFRDKNKKIRIPLYTPF